MTDLVPTDGASDIELLRVAAAVEASSEHPLARAVEEAADERDIAIPAVEDFRSHTGHGVEARLEGARILVGKPAYLEENGVLIETVIGERLETLESQGKTVVAVARGEKLLGLIAIADTVKADAAEAIARMRQAGLAPVMVTGDNERTARAVGAEVGIDEVHAQVLPGEKAKLVRELQTRGRRVAMVGDGVNGAPALTQADVGIAMGGTDIAIESADVVIVGGRLVAVMDAYDIGRSSYTKTKQNLALAFALNGIGVAITVTGLVHPVWAMVAMVTSVSAVLLNSFGGRLVPRARTSRHGSMPLAEPSRS